MVRDALWMLFERLMGEFWRYFECVLGACGMVSEVFFSLLSCGAVCFVLDAGGTLSDFWCQASVLSIPYLINSLSAHKDNGS